MKICFVGDINSIHVQKWARYFANNNDQVFVITTGYYPNNWWGEVRVFSLSNFNLISRLLQLYRSSAFIKSALTLGMSITSAASSILPTKIQEQIALTRIRKR